MHKIPFVYQLHHPIVKGVQKTTLQLVCNRCDKIVDVIGEVGFDALVVMETWLTGIISDQKIVGDVTPLG